MHIISTTPTRPTEPQKAKNIQLQVFWYFEKQWKNTFMKEKKKNWKKENQQTTTTMKEKQHSRIFYAFIWKSASFPDYKNNWWSLKNKVSSSGTLINPCVRNSAIKFTHEPWTMSSLLMYSTHQEVICFRRVLICGNMFTPPFSCICRLLTPMDRIRQGNI